MSQKNARKDTDQGGKLAKLIHFIKEYRIHTEKSLQFQGVKDTLLGWAIIALTFIFRKEIQDPALLQASFFVIFLSGVVGRLHSAACSWPLHQSPNQLTV